MAEFHISKDETINKTIRMRKSLIDEITTLAVQHGISFNALVVQMAEFSLKHLPNANKAIQDNEHPNKDNT